MGSSEITEHRKGDKIEQNEHICIKTEKTDESSHTQLPTPGEVFPGHLMMNCYVSCLVRHQHIHQDKHKNDKLFFSIIFHHLFDKKHYV